VASTRSFRSAAKPHQTATPPPANPTATARQPKSKARGPAINTFQTAPMPITTYIIAIVFFMAAGGVVLIMISSILRNPAATVRQMIDLHSRRQAAGHLVQNTLAHRFKMAQPPRRSPTAKRCKTLAGGFRRRSGDTPRKIPTKPLPRARRNSPRVETRKPSRDLAGKRANEIRSRARPPKFLNI
jgi:hypothetical protein